MQGFHIDHFAPKSKFPNLKSKYCNLVYSCPFCNGAKSAKWVGNDSSIPHDGNKGFIDPCNSEYDRHLKRNANGQILGRTNLGDYMVEHLDLSLLRHQYCWLSQRLLENREKLLSLIPNTGGMGERHVDLLELIIFVTSEYERIRKKKRSTLNATNLRKNGTVYTPCEVATSLTRRALAACGTDKLFHRLGCYPWYCILSTDFSDQPLYMMRQPLANFVVLQTCEVADHRI